MRTGPLLSGAFLIPKPRHLHLGIRFPRTSSKARSTRSCPTVTGLLTIYLEMLESSTWSTWTDLREGHSPRGTSIPTGPSESPAPAEAVVVGSRSVDRAISSFSTRAHFASRIDTDDGTTGTTATW